VIFGATNSEKKKRKEKGEQLALPLSSLSSEGPDGVGPSKKPSKEDKRKGKKEKERKKGGSRFCH